TAAPVSSPAYLGQTVVTLDQERSPAVGFLLTHDLAQDQTALARAKLFPTFGLESRAAEFVVRPTTSLIPVNTHAIFVHNADHVRSTPSASHAPRQRLAGAKLLAAKTQIPLPTVRVRSTSVQTR